MTASHCWTVTVSDEGSEILVLSTGNYRYYELYNQIWPLRAVVIVYHMLRFVETCHVAVAVNYNNNQLWCKSTTNPVPVLRIAASRGFSELTKNVTGCPMVTPHLQWKFHANRFSGLLVMLLTEISIGASRGFSDLTQNWIGSSHGHSSPSLKFHANRSSHFLVILLTKKQRYKEINRKQTPSRDLSGMG